MKSKLESLFAWLALLAFLILPFVLLLAISIPGHLASGKQVTMDRARASLSAALSDYLLAGQTAAFQAKRYGYFVVSACRTTNMILVDGISYHCALMTSEDYQFANQGILAITTNREFIWFDYRRGAKLIPVDYQVSKWRTGY